MPTASSIATLTLVLQLAILLLPVNAGNSAVAAESRPVPPSTSPSTSQAKSPAASPPSSQVSAGKACKEQYMALNKQHEKALNNKNNKPGTRAYAIALYEVEQAIFPALKQCPDNVEIVSLMGEVQISTGQIPFAIQYGRKAVKMDPKVWQANYLLGSALNLKKEYNEGIKYLLIASQLVPGKNTLKFNICSAYTAAKKYAQAIVSCTDLIKQNDKRLSGPAHYMRARAYTGQGKTKAAKEDRTIARKLGFKEIK